MLHFVDVESGEDDVEIVCATAPGDCQGRRGGSRGCNPLMS